MGKGCGCGASKVLRVPSMNAQPVVQDEDDEAFWNLYVSWTNDDEQVPERPTTAPTTATSSLTGAVRLSYFLDFVANRLPTGDPNMPTWSVALNIVQTDTSETDQPYVCLPEMTPHVLPYGTTTPYYFVSHAWTRPLREAANMLAHHFRGRDPRDVYVWLDIFAVRQQSFTATPKGPDIAVLDAALRNSAGVLLCLDEAGVVLRRTWCLYEAWIGATATTLGHQPSPTPSTIAASPPQEVCGVGSAWQEKEEAKPRPGSAAEGNDSGGGHGEVPPPPPSPPPPPPSPIGVSALTLRTMLPEERARLFMKIDIRQSRCKYSLDRDTLLTAARAAAGPGALDAVNATLRLALTLQPLISDVYPDLSPGRMIEVPGLWDMSPVDNWLALSETSRNFSALALYGTACSGKSVAAAAIARHLRSRNIPVAAHFCNVSDVRTLDPVTVVTSLALQLARAPIIGPRMLRQYGDLPAGLVADLLSYNSTPLALDAAVESLLVQPLQMLLHPEEGYNDGSAMASATTSATNAGGRGWHDNGDLGALGGGADEVLEAEAAAGGGGNGLQAVGARSLRVPSKWQGPPTVVVLIIDGIDQADGAIMGGAAPFDNHVLQFVEEQIPKLPSFVRIVLTSRSLSYIVPRLADRLSPMELSLDALRPEGPFMRNIRLAIASIDPALSIRSRIAAAANLVAKSCGSLLYIKMALCCLELERDVAVAEAEADLIMAAMSFNGRSSGSAATPSITSQTDGVRRTLNRLASSKKQPSSHQLPSSLGGLLERYLAIRLRLLNSTELRNQAATVLAVLAAAREPLSAMQVAATMGGGGWVKAASGAAASSTEAAAAAAAALLAPPPVAPERMLQEFVSRGLGALVRLRGRSGHHTQEVLLIHSAVSEWLQRPRPLVLLAGSVIVDLAAGHRALAAHCRDDALSCLHRGRLPPYSYSLRHIFLHVGLAAMDASAAEAAEAAAATAAGPISPSSVGTTSRSGHLRSRSGTTSYNSSAAVALAAALAAAAATADWIATLELLLQRLDLWTSIYTAGAGFSARWVVLALASLPACSVPSADPGSSESPLSILLAEARRWLLLYHNQLCWFPLAVVASAATLPEDSALRSRALEFSAGPDPWECMQSKVTTITVTPAQNRRKPATKKVSIDAAAAEESPPSPLRANGRSGVAVLSGVVSGTAPHTAGAAATELKDPLEAEHLLLLSTGDVWTACMQTLRTNAGRVLQVAMQPAGRLVATVHDEQHGIVLWDIWGARPLLTFARSSEIGPNPTAAFFTPDGRRLVCAARSVFVWEVASGRLEMELVKAAPKKSSSGSIGFLLGGGGSSSAGSVIGAASVDGRDPEGRVTALALSPGGSRVAAGHATGAIRVWDLPSGKLLCAMSVHHRRPVTALAFQPTRGSILVTAHGEGSDAAPKALAPVESDELGDVPTAFIKADELLIHVWRIQGNNPKELEVLKGHTGRLNAIGFSSLDGNMVTASADETIRVWWDDPKTPQSDYRQIFILGGAGQGAVHTIQYGPLPPGLTTLGSSPSAPPTSANAADLDNDIHVVDLTAPSATCLATAAFGTNAAPSRGADGVATPDGSSAALASMRDNCQHHDVGRGGGGGMPYDDDDDRGDVPVMAYSCGNGIVRLWSPVQQRQVGLLRGMEGPVSSLSFSGDGRLLASADQSANGMVRIWDVGGASMCRPLECSPSSGAGGLPLRQPVELMALSPDGSRLAVVCADVRRESLRVIDVFTGRRMAVMGPGGAGGHEGKINALAWSWDSSRVATGSDDLSVRVWYVGKPTAPPGDKLATAAAVVAAEMAQRDNPVAVEPTLPPQLPAAAPLPVRRQLRRPSDDDTCASRHLMRIPSAGPSETSEATGGGGDAGGVSVPATVASSTTAGGGWAAAATAASAVGDSGLPSSDLHPGQCQLILTGHHRKVQCVAWAHDGRKLASGGYDQMIRIWDTTSGEQVNLIYQSSWVSALAFSQDDARLVSGAGGRAVYMFNSTTGKNLAGYSGALPGSGGGAAAAAAGPASASRPSTAEAQVAAGEDDLVDSSWMAALRFNPDGTLLACRDMHSTITLWDVSGMRLKPLRAMDGRFREALFCPSSGDLQLYDRTESGALVISAIPCASLPLGRVVQRAVTLSHPLLEFRGVAVDTAVNHNSVAMLTADNRAFFYVNGAHLSAVRLAAVQAEHTAGTPGSTTGNISYGINGASGGGGGWSATAFGGGGDSLVATTSGPWMR